MARSTEPVEEDGDDLLPVPGGVAAPAGKPKRRQRSKPKAEKPLNDLGNSDEGGDDHSGPSGELEMDGMPQYNRRTMELEAQMQARLTKQPVFPYPPELREELKPYWLELVNSFPADHFQISDTTLMKMYCQCAYDIERQSLLIADEGEVVLGGKGPMVNPRCKVRESNRNALMTLTTKFRNQPASRVNTENFGTRQGKTAAAGRAADTANGDGDDLLARPGQQQPIRTRH